MRTTDIDAAGKSRRSSGRRGILANSRLVLGIVALAVLPGCDANSWVPSRPPELGRSPTAVARTPGTALPTASTTPAAAASPTARPRLVELILARPASLDRLYLEQVLRRETGLKKCAFRAVSPEDNVAMDPGKFASEIRSAANRSTGALIVEPVDSPEVRQALREAESKGLGVVLLDSPLPATSPGKPYPYVTFQGFAEAGKQLVASLAEDAKVLRLPADGTTLLIENGDRDFYSKDRLESITSALKAAGRAYDRVSFVGEQKAATDAVLEYLDAHPKLTVIVADHELGVGGAFDAREQWYKTHKSIFVVGGYYACDARLIPTMKTRLQGLVDRNVEGYARKALETALDLIDGKPVPDRVFAEVRLIHTPARYTPPATPAVDQGKRATEGSGGEKPKRKPRADFGTEPQPGP